MPGLTTGDIGGCCCPEDICCALPCPLAATDLNFTIAMDEGPVASILHYSSASGGCQWESPCVTVPSGTGPYSFVLTIQLVGSCTLLEMALYVGTSCGGAVSSVADYQNPAGCAGFSTGNPISLLSYSCNPLQLAFSFSFQAGPGGYLSITGPAPTNPGRCPSSHTFEVFGCGSQPYPGITVTVYDATGTTQLATGQTAANGQVLLTWPSPGTGNFTVQLAGLGARFAPYRQLIALVDGGTTTIAPGTVSPYVCMIIPGCLQPTANTLNATLTPPLGPTAVLQSIPGSYQGFDASGNGLINMFYDGTLVIEYQAPGVGLCTTATFSPTSIACPPGLHLSYNITDPCYSGIVTISE